MSRFNGLLAFIAVTCLLQGVNGVDGNSGVTYDSRSAILDGKRTLILSGAIHYVRVPVSDWPRLFTMAKNMGLNTIQTYVMWNFHEHKRGELVWDTDRANLKLFIQQAHEAGLYVVVRIGPYICGEYYFGGIPIWMRDVDNVTCFRCSDPIWEREMQKFVGEVVDQTRDFLYPAGPVIMLQVENEYGGPDQPYLEWSVDMARNLTTQVPWNLCHDVTKCTLVNNGTNKALCTINGFWEDQWDGTLSQPSPSWLQQQRGGNPTQPAIWTEDQGWFDQWGVAQRYRLSSDQSYGIMRWFAYGGAWHNFYMLTGGNNYGRQAGGVVTTAYAPDTVIDFLLLRHQPRYDFYTHMFNALQDASDALLSNEVPQAEELQPKGSLRGGASQQLTAVVTTCYQYQSPSQEWVFLPSEKNAGTDGSAPLTSLDGNASGLCLGPSLTPLSFVPCANAPGWQYDKKTGHLQSTVVAPCRKHGSSGNCTECLDHSGASVTLWDCKGASDPEQDNQVWIYDTTTSLITTSTATQCLTSQAPGGKHGTGVEAHRYGSVAFLSNFQTVGEEVLVDYQGKEYHLPGHSVVFVTVASGEVLFNTSDVVDEKPSYTDDDDDRTVHGHVVSGTEWKNAVEWVALRETAGNGSRTNTSTSGPIEQLVITDNDSDYLWYITEIALAFLVDGDGAPAVHVSGQGGSISYVYIEGQLVGTGSGTYTLKVDAHVAARLAGRGLETVKLQILSCAMGLYNGGDEPTSTKGVGKVSVNGKDITSQAWTMRWMLAGETEGIFDPSVAPSVASNMVPASSIAANETIVWFSTYLDLPKVPGSEKAGPGASQPINTSFVLYLASMNKGVAYVNGFNIGRYSAQPGEGDCSPTGCAPPHHGPQCYLYYKNCGKPTQTVYHVPFEVLKPTHNLVVLFEETAQYQGDTGRDLSKVALQALTEHPM
eukprot:m.605106 g.605106  ORF g.605106 m.605106 type:complete len:933 (-) comp22463_c5_seq2:159-2957(-)